MLALWLGTGILASAGEAPPSPDQGSSGYGSWNSVLRKLSADEEARLDIALDDLERSIRQARTPRVRIKKIADAESAIAKATAIVAPVATDLPAFADLTELSLTLRSIAAGMLEYPDFRVSMLEMVRAARLEAEAFRADEESSVFLLLLSN